MLHRCACNIDAYHYVATDPSNEDHVWASRVLSDISIEPRLIGNEVANVFFRSDVEVEEPETGGPSSGVRDAYICGPLRSPVQITV